MVRAVGLSALLSFLVLSGFSQQTDTVPKRLSSSYVSIQANQLFRQLFNLGGTSAPVNNPYLMTYSVNSTKNGWGFSVGLGLTVNEFRNDDEFTIRETEISELSLRMGPEKKSTLGKRWLLSAGIDLVIDAQKNNTKTTNINSGTNNIVETTNKTNGWGLGPHVGLSFHISDKILIGTEANYYLKFLKTTSVLTQWPQDTQTETSKTKRFQLNVPAVLFLTLKF